MAAANIRGQYKRTIIEKKIKEEMSLFEDLQPGDQQTSLNQPVEEDEEDFYSENAEGDDDEEETKADQDRQWSQNDIGPDG